jgi:hypothetical protein
MAITAFQWEDGPNHTQRVSIPWEIVMIRIRSGMVAVAGLLVGVLSTAAFAQLEEIVNAGLASATASLHRLRGAV